MSPSHDPKLHLTGDGRSLWDSRIVPSARACERFFWNLVWFVVIVALLFSFNPLRSGPSLEHQHIQGSME